MKTSSGISEIVENIMTSYEERVKAIADLSKETAEMCRRFRKEREQNDIRGHLAKEEKNRLKDYNSMMSGINKNLNDIRKEVAGLTNQSHTMIADFRKERKHNDIKGKLAKGEKTRQKEYHNMMDGIHKDLDSIHKEVSDLIGGTQTMMAEFHQENQQMAAEWQAMENAISGKERNSPPRARAVKKTTAAPAVRNQTKAVVHAAPPQEESQEEEVETAAPRNLEAMVMKYIAKHAKDEGVKIGEMEEPLGVIRLKLGKVVKELLEQGKVRKENNRYFPQ